MVIWRTKFFSAAIMGNLDCMKKIANTYRLTRHNFPVCPNSIIFQISLCDSNDNRRQIGRWLLKNFGDTALSTVLIEQAIDTVIVNNKLGLGQSSHVYFEMQNGELKLMNIPFPQVGLSYYINTPLPFEIKK